MPFLICPKCETIRDWVPPLHDLRPFASVCLKCCKAFAAEERHKHFADAIKQQAQQDLREAAQRIMGGPR